MAGPRKPRSPIDFASMVPESARDDALREVSEAEQAKAKFAEKRKQAARISHLDGETGFELARHDEEAADRRHKQAKDAKPTALKARKGSRRRRKADAWSERGDRLNRRMREHLKKYEARLRQLGQDDANPVGVPPLAWGTSQAIMSDPTGHTARIKLASLPREQARMIMAAALRPAPYQAKRERLGRELRACTKDRLGGPSRWWQEPGVRRWCHPAALRTVALGVALWHMRKRTSRRGFSAVVRGIPRRMLCALAADGMTGVRPGLSALFGNMDGVPGAMRALGEAGFLSIQQPPGAKVRACDRGPTGFAFNVYWFFSKAGASAEAPPEAAEVEAMRDASFRAELGLVERGPPTVAA